MSDTIDEHFAAICIMSDLINHWLTEEINSNGSTFTYDSQDIFREYLNVGNKLNFKEIINVYPKSDFRKIALKGLPDLLKSNIDLYEKHKSLFESYDRNRLQLDTFRKLHKSNATDQELKIEILKYTELMNRDEYYNSSFYNDIGFLSVNFHYHIYMYSKRLLKDIETNFVDYKGYDSDYLFKNNEELFPMTLIAELHLICNNVIFEKCKITNFYDELNFFHVNQNVKPIVKQNNKIYYVIYKLSNLISDSKIKAKWVLSILHNFNLKKSSYDSKYLTVYENESSSSFVDSINVIFKKVS